MRPRLLAALFLFLVAPLMATETAPFTTERADDRFSIRLYPALVVAETALADAPDSDDGAFTRLFRYIGGRNSAGRKIAMTTPVFQDATAMRFVLPADLTLDRAPAPLDASVRLARTEPVRVAAYPFSGRSSSGNTAEARAALLAWLAAQKLTPEGDVFFAYYNSPFVPPLFRHNEALVRLRE